MKQQTQNAPDDQLLAVVERRSDRLRVVLVRKGDRPTVLETRDLNGSDQSGMLSWLESQRCADIRVILPASSTIVRQTTMPSGIPSHMIAALRLQAEGMFLGSIPSHRMGLALLPDTGDAERQGVILAWPNSQSTTRDFEFSPKQEKLIRYVPEVAAMIVLAAGDLPAVAADRRAGSIAIAMRSPKGLVLRATREAVGDDAASVEAWNDGLRNAIAETALNAGIEPARVAAIVAETEAASQQGKDTTTMLDPGIREILGAALQAKVDAATTDSDGWRDWAIPLAAAVVACGPLAELAKFKRLEEGAKSSNVEYLIRRYSDPARALRVCVAAVVVLGLAPIAFAWTRGKIIEWKLPESAGAFEKNQREIELRISHYRELGKRALPVAKILGDLACCTPDGIEIESIQVSANQGLIVRGISKAKSDTSAENLITEMASLMDASQVFEKTRTRWDPGDGRGVVKFDIEAPVVRPTLRSEFPELRDWSVKTLAQRKFGAAEEDDGGADIGATSAGGAASGARPTTEPAEITDAATNSATTAGDPTTLATASGSNDLAEKPSTSVSGPARGIGRRTEATAPKPATGADGGATSPSTSPSTATGTGATTPTTGSTGAGSGGGPAAAALANSVVPDSFTDEELRAMTRDQARGLLADFSRAKRRQDLDAETRKRIDDDFKRILEFLKSTT